MKSLVFLVCTLIISGCSHRQAISLDDRMENSKIGYEMALRSGIDDLTENAIYQIVLKRMNGFLENTEGLESELSQFILICDNEVTQKKAILALHFLTTMNNFEIAKIRAEYNNKNKLFQLLEKHISTNTSDYSLTQ
jgi:hypothetical protein